MWYCNTVTVQQNPFFYTQYGQESHPKNKIDRTKYIFEGHLGAWFKSFENKEPKIGDNRWICDKEFKAWKVHPKKRWLIFTEYEIWWTPVQGENTVDEIREFYASELLKLSI